MATHSSILAWRIPWTEEPGRVQPMGSHRVGYNQQLSTLRIITWEREALPRKQNVIVVEWCVWVFEFFDKCGNRKQTSLHWLWMEVKILVAQSCPTLCDPMNCGPPGSSVHGILQGGTLEWVAIPFSRGSSWPRDRTRVFCVFCVSRQVLYHWCHWEAI